MPDRADPAGIVAAHLDAWNAPEGPVRDGAVGAVYTDDVFVGEPDAAHRGHEGMSRAIAALHAQVPGAVISRSGPIGTAQDLVTYAWTLGVDGGPAVASGRDVLLLRDGRVSALYVLLDPAGDQG